MKARCFLGLLCGFGLLAQFAEPLGAAEEKPIPPALQAAPLVLNPEQVFNVPDLPGRTSPFYMHAIGLYSDGNTGALGSPTYYLIAQYGGKDNEIDGFRWVILDSFDGYHVRASFHDIDGDGVPELVVEYLIGADSPRVHIYAFRPDNAESRFRYTREGIDRIFREPGTIRTWHEDGSFDFCAPWHCEMKGDPPLPVRHEWKDGRIQPRP